MTPSTARADLIARLQQAREWDLAVIGGGATGLGVALDAAARGLSVVLCEATDFAQGSSSRATKLVHGGVRYMAQGRIGLVREALHERSVLLANAPHLAQPLAFVVPSRTRFAQALHGIGLTLYDALSGTHGLGGTEWLSSSRTLELLPGVRHERLRGGVKYWDGQFDDARLAVALARTAAAHGALLLNHMPVVALRRSEGRVHGLVVEDAETGLRHEVQARCVVNATGVWVDAVRDMDRDPGSPARPPLVAPSQGVHLVVDRTFLPGTHGLLVPRTTDGRVLFVVPWLGKLILGTTDTPRDDIVREPRPFEHELDFILGEAGRHLERAPVRADVRSLWVGLRPLVRPSAEHAATGEAGHAGGDTQAISREHTVIVGRSGLVTVTGGKWTTYRAMAEDVLDRAMAAGLLPRRPGGVTVHLPLAGAAPGRPLSEPPGEHLYGSDVTMLRGLPGAANWLWRDAESGEGGLSEAMVRFAVRLEMARDVEDVLARRSRLLFLDAAEATRQAEPVARILAEELGPGFDAPSSAQRFRALAQRYRLVE